MLRAIKNKSWREHPTRHQLYSHLPPITNTIQIRRTRHAGHCWRSRDKRISDELLWTPTYGRTKVGRPARTYIQQLCDDTGYNPEDLSEAMNDREKWQERVRDIHAGGTTWWWILKKRKINGGRLRVGFTTCQPFLGYLMPKSFFTQLYAFKLLFLFINIISENKKDSKPLYIQTIRIKSQDIRMELKNVPC